MDGWMGRDGGEGGERGRLFGMEHWNGNAGGVLDERTGLDWIGLDWVSGWVE